MNQADAQAVLFDQGDGQVTTERGSDEANCAFCAVIRGDSQPPSPASASAAPPGA
jgi:hypothetical protein